MDFCMCITRAPPPTHSHSPACMIWNRNVWSPIDHWMRLGWDMQDSPWMSFLIQVDRVLLDALWNDTLVGFAKPTCPEQQDLTTHFK